LPKSHLRDTHDLMDAAAHYRTLIALGRDEFLAAAAPAAFVRFREPGSSSTFDQTMTIDQDSIDETLPHGQYSVTDIGIELYPLAKKPGASFPDRITIGRTSNNDICVADHSVSRLHAYVRQHGPGWAVADAGSKNGSWLRGEKLEPRRERPLTSRNVLRIGDVDLTFYTAIDLFSVLGGGA
jgi:pSer/pThr/pTyr-binding forkhead associated (FHA) protein